MPEFKTFTYKDDRENSKNSSKNSKNVVGVKEEDLIDVAEDNYKPGGNSMDTFKYSSAKQNEWVRMVFQKKKSIEQIYEEIEEFALKSKQIYRDPKNDKLFRKGTEFFGSGSPQYKNAVNDSEAWALKRGVESALEFALYFDKNFKKDGDRLLTNDSIDAANKIDFVQTSAGENGNLDVINLIQIKSSRPANDIDIELIQKEHKNYLKNIERITEKELENKIILDHSQEVPKIVEEYGKRIFNLMFNLLESGKEKKEKAGNTIMEDIIRDNNITFTHEDLIFLSRIMDNNLDSFFRIMTAICGDKIDDLDLSVFENWLSGKSSMANQENKKDTFKEYKPTNIVSGRRFNSVIYYKGSDKWGKIVSPLD